MKTQDYLKLGKLLSNLSINPMKGQKSTGKYH